MSNPQDMMRTRAEIEHDADWGADPIQRSWAEKSVILANLQLEVLLDIRDLLSRRPTDTGPEGGAS